MCWVSQLCKCCYTISLLTRTPLSRTSAALAGATQGFTLFFMDVCATQYLSSCRFLRPLGSFPFRPLNTALRKSLGLCCNWTGHSGDKYLCLAVSSALGFFLYWHRVLTSLSDTNLLCIASTLVLRFLTLCFISRVIPSAREYKRFGFIRHQDIRLNPVSGL